MAILEAWAMSDRVMHALFSLATDAGFYLLIGCFVLARAFALFLVGRIAWAFVRRLWWGKQAKKKDEPAPASGSGVLVSDLMSRRSWGAMPNNDGRQFERGAEKLTRNLGRIDTSVSKLPAGDGSVDN